MPLGTATFSSRRCSLQPELLPGLGCRPVAAPKAAGTVGRESVRGRAGFCSGRWTTVASWRRTSRHSGTKWPRWKPQLRRITRPSPRLEVEVIGLFLLFSQTDVTPQHLSAWSFIRARKTTSWVDPQTLRFIHIHSQSLYLYCIPGLHDNDNCNSISYPASRFAYRSERNARVLAHFHMQKTLYQKVDSVICRMLGHKAVLRSGPGGDDRG